MIQPAELQSYDRPLNVHLTKTFHIMIEFIVCLFMSRESSLNTSSLPDSVRIFFNNNNKKKKNCEQKRNVYQRSPKNYKRRSEKPIDKLKF